MTPSAPALLQRRIEDRPPEAALKKAPKAKFQLRSVKRRGRQLTPKRLDIKHGEDVAGNAKDLLKRLTEPLHRREAADPFDACGTRQRSVVSVLQEMQGQFVRRARDDPLSLSQKQSRCG
jgi:hypothetical protein